MRRALLDLAEELEGYQGGTCEECAAYEQPECRGYLSCSEIVAKYCARKVREVADKADDHSEDVSVSAYNLLPDEDREALRWVREYGGLEAVKASIHQGAMGHGCLLKIAHTLGTSIYDGTGNADALLDKLEKRLMPAGCEWPRYEDGETLQWDDEYANGNGGVSPFRRVNLYADGVAVLGKNKTKVVLAPGQRVKRPAVLAADGEPLEVGQTVYDVEDGKTHHVTEVDAVSKRFRSMEQIDGSHWLDPMLFTHQRPVLDADGVPIREGDTVYEVGENYPPFIVSCLPKPGAYRSVTVVYPSGAFTFLDPERLTHTKPEPPDTWERIEREIERGKTYTDELVLSIVRRCKALAKRGE